MSALISSVKADWVKQNEIARINNINEDYKLQKLEVLKALEKWGHLIKDGQCFRLCYLAQLASDTDSWLYDRLLINFCYVNSFYLRPFVKHEGKFSQI